MKNSPRTLWKQHGIKAVSLVLLLGIGLILWYHKEHGRFPVVTHTQTAVNIQPPAEHLPQIFPNIVTAHKELTTLVPKPQPIITPPTIKQAPEAPTPMVLQKNISQKNLISMHTVAYTLQLIGSRHRDTLKQFLQKYPLQQRARILTTIYKNKPWYVVTYGKFDTMAEAKKARRQLPPALQALHPWIRRIVFT